MNCVRFTKQFSTHSTSTNIFRKHFYKSKILFGGAYKDTTLSTGTIYSLSSAATKSAIAVIRISGEDASKALLCLTPTKPLPKDRVATFRDLFHPKTKEKLDSALVLFFKGPKSFTGEDVIELHVHGGRAVIHDTLAALADVEGITLTTAKPGEFARRAFENGKLDLTKVEAIADLINAETQAQRKQAIRQLDGQLTHLYSSWRQSIIQALAHYEAVIDFGDDEQISTEVAMAVVPKMQELAQKIQDHLNDGRRGERMRDGAQIAIVGPPNSGKSSLINILCNRQAAIVSPIPGTTRDVVEVTLNFAGFPVVLSDTAGIRSSEDVIEQEGIHRAKQRFQHADLKLCMFDATEFPNNVTPMIAELMDKDTMVVLNKADLLKDEPQQALPKLRVDFQKWLKDHKTGLDAQTAKMQLISCKNGKYIPEFLKALEQEVKNCFTTQNMDAPLITRSRHREQLMECLKSLNTFLDMVRNGEEVVLAAEELRYAVKAIARITGQVDVEDILDIVFSDFCIGK